MELRSSRNRNEYKELQITLNGMGFYEEGMELQEMRQILDALAQSVTQSETKFYETDMEKAIRESEMDFMPSNNEKGMWNSTMLGSYDNTSPCSSPEIVMQRITIHAEVHHPMDWSPPSLDGERLQRKRLASHFIIENNDSDSIDLSESLNEVVEPNAKRLHQHESPVLKHQSLVIDESHVNLNKTGERAFCNPVTNQNISNEILAEEEDADESIIQIIGPISMRRPINDSGVNCEMANNKSTDSFSTSQNDNKQNTIEDWNASENLSLVSNENEPILDLPSMQGTTNDSGLYSNASAEPSSSSLSWNLGLVNENSMKPFDANGNGNYDDDDDDDDDYEHSEPSI